MTRKPDASLLIFRICAVVVVLGLAFTYGVMAQKHRLFPMPQIRSATEQIKELLAPSDQILVASNVRYDTPVESLLPDRLAPGLLMVAEIVQDRDTAVRIIDRSGQTIHEWRPVWSEVWPGSTGNFPEDRRPKGDSGMYLHGVDILPDASIVANFEHLSSFRMDVCGAVSWKLDNLGHHAVHYSDQGATWVAAERYVQQGPTGYQNHAAPLRSWTLQEVSDDGEVLREISMIDVFLRNGLEGLLFMSTLSNGRTVVRGDTLHLNDVDIFPEGMASSVFDPGDIMVSLRNINTIAVFDPDTLEMKFVSTGQVLRHHDPDFMPGDRISIFDNRNLTPSTEPIPPASRVVEVNARTGEASVALNGEGPDGFFTNIMGVHQRLPNGNILVTSSGEGRALEYLPDGQLAWRYSNRISEEINGRIFMTKLLPADMDAAFFETRAATCN
ncbi:arylsulfotransferase family protein [uncultured Roseobacter sp.]|uniref:arylsulfotransferase family protein n=1 Tax=uncultured Roseobacter sp. TaxID=114847 RepID=UPI002618469A|nr:arylsulfotransferase family protein [uncultured Roseobacter sp.]